MQIFEAERPVPGNPTALRDDLAFMVRVAKTTGLAEAIFASGISRVLEVNVGNNFSAIKALAGVSIREDNQPHFTKYDLWAIEPDSNQYKPYTGIESPSRYATYLNNSVQEIFQGIIDGKIPPFDLVVARGVVSMVNLGSDSIYSGKLRGREVIENMRTCLNPFNPRSKLVLSSKSKGLIPYTPEELESLGLRTLALQKTDNEYAELVLGMLKFAGLYQSDLAIGKIICERL